MNTINPSSKPPMPCFAFPNPTSSSPIPFTFERRHFTVKTLPDNFPYEVIRDNGLQIHYFEFRGDGLPPPDLGSPGDVWMNTKQGELSLYARLHAEWVIWPGPRKAKKQMFEHPLVPGRYLWCTRKHILWYTCDGIRKSASLQTRGEEEDFGRQRYRTVGPMERGGARNVNDGTPRMPLRSAAEAIAKILELEDDDHRQGRDAPEVKRRRVRESEAASEAGGASSSMSPGGAHSEGRSSSFTAPKFPASASRFPSGFYVPPHESPSSLSQALVAHADTQAQAQALASPSMSAPVQNMPLPPQPPPPNPNEVAGPSSVPPQPVRPPPIPTAPNSYASLPPNTPPAPLPHPSESDSARMREENWRLGQENRRLGEENTRLAQENERLKTQQNSSTLIPPELTNAVRDAMTTALGTRVQHLLAVAEEQRVARGEAERKLAEFQEQLKKMTQAFQLPGIVSRADNSLNTPGPSPRMATTDS